MSDPVTISLIAAVAGMGTVFSPLILAYVSGRQRRREQVQQWEREDRVAVRAAEAEARAADSARLLLAVNREVVEATTVTNGKLDVIHGLVNSNLTTAMQAEYDATVRTLALMREVVALRREAGADPSVDAIAAIAATETRVAELKLALNERFVQSDLAARRPSSPDWGLGRDDNPSVQ